MQSGYTEKFSDFPFNSNTTANVTEATSSMATNNNTILAVNGDYYGVDRSGYMIKNGEISVDQNTEVRQAVFSYSERLYLERKIYQTLSPLTHPRFLVNVWY